MTDNHRFRPSRYSSESDVGPGYVGWRNDFEDLKVAYKDLKKKNEELRIEKEHLVNKITELEQNKLENIEDKVANLSKIFEWNSKD